LNQAGRDYLVSKTGTIAKFMFISEMDSDYNTNITGAEFVQFGSSSARLVLRYNSKRLENQKARVYFAVAPVPVTIAGMQLVWTGVVDTYEKDDKILTLTLKQNDHKKNRMIPDGIITTATFPDCPEENVGKPYPVIFGDFYPTSTPHGTHEDGIGIDSAGGITGLEDYAPALIIKPWGGSYEEPGEIIIAGHAVLNSFVGVPAFWNGSRKTFERMWAQFAALEPHISADGSVYLEYFPKDRPLTDGSGLVISHHDFIGHAFSVIPSRVVRYDSATTPERAYSGITADHATLDASGGYIDFGFDQQGAFSERELVELVFDLVMVGSAFMTVELYDVDTELNVSGSDGITHDMEGATVFDSTGATFLDDGIVEDDLLVITEGVNAGEWPIQEATLQTRLVLKWNAQSLTNQSYKVLTRGALIESIGGGSITASGQKIIPLTYFIEDPLKYVIRLTQTSGAGSWQIKNLQVRIYSPDVEKPEMIFLDKQGMKYGSWITGRGFTSGYLIENPAGVIEGFARNEMIFATAEIDTAAFDTAATAISGAKLAFQLMERTGARELLDDISLQSRLKTWWDEQDRLTVLKFNEAAHFPNSGMDIPGARDTFTTTGSPLAGSFTTHQIIKGPVIRPIESQNVKNDFIIKYRKNYATGDYAGVLRVNKDESNLNEAYLNGTTNTILKARCASAYAAVKTVNTYEGEAWAIRDEATATALMQHLIERLARVPFILEFDAGPSTLQLELGDFTNVRDDLVQDRFGAAVMNVKKWEIIGYEPDPNTHDVHLIVIEV
jgi:hypothetical protein